MDIMKLYSIDDARVFVDNSGVADWEWGEIASAEGFADWLWHNRTSVDRQDYDADLREYLLSEGEDPKDYSL